MAESALVGEVLAKIGGVAALIVAVLVAAWQAFKHLSGKWLEDKFATRLKKLEQQHDMAVRHLQSSIDRELDRARKLSAQEFDSLSEGWALLHDAYWRARDVTGRMRRVHQFEGMTAGQADNFIQRSDLEEWQKVELRALAAPAERTAYYRKAMDWLALSQGKQSRQQLVMFIDRAAIFMLPEVRALFDQLEIMVNAALTEFSIRLEMPGEGRQDFTHNEILGNEGHARYRELETRIHDRLWSAASVALTKQE